MTKLKSIALTLAIISLIGIIVGNSYAFEIERMYPSYGGYYDYSGWLYHSACVEQMSRIQMCGGILTMNM